MRWKRALSALSIGRAADAAVLFSASGIRPQGNEFSTVSVSIHGWDQSRRFGNKDILVGFNIKKLLTLLSRETARR
ncbi:MAG TPA: hypothetical protein VGD08_24440 [Stellaceae bacterium]|jgi:hypothetical protein